MFANRQLPEARSSRMSVVILAAVCFCWMAETLAASCGDYLMPLHHGSAQNVAGDGWHWEATSSHGAMEVVGRFSASWFANPLARGSLDPQSSNHTPGCHGPRCGGSSNSAMSVAVVIVPDPLTIYLSSAVHDETPERARGCNAQILANSTLESQADLDGLFRPPRYGF